MQRIASAKDILNSIWCDLYYERRFCLYSKYTNLWVVVKL